MTPEIIVTVAGIFLSAVFEYVPKVEGWYNTLEKKVKAAIMALSVLLVVAVAGLISCYGPYDYLACSQAGFWDGAELFVLALVVNQTTHSLIRKDRTYDPVS